RLFVQQPPQAEEYSLHPFYPSPSALPPTVSINADTLLPHARSKADLSQWTDPLHRPQAAHAKKQLQQISSGHKSHHDPPPLKLLTPVQLPYPPSLPVRKRRPRRSSMRWHVVPQKVLEIES